MNWYKEQIQNELLSLENSLRKSYDFINREDVPEELKVMMKESHNKKLRRYKELKKRLGEGR